MEYNVIINFKDGTFDDIDPFFKMWKLDDSLIIDNGFGEFSYNLLTIKDIEFKEM